MRPYKMTLYIEKPENENLDGFKEFVDDTLDGAVLSSFSNTPSGLEVSFRQSLAGGETQEDFLLRVAIPIWRRLGRYTPLGLNVIDLSAPVWDTYEEGEDTAYFDEASCEYHQTKERMFKGHERAWNVS